MLFGLIKDAAMWKDQSFGIPNKALLDLFPEINIGDPFWRTSMPNSPILLPCNESVTDIPWSAVLSKSMPNNRPIASFARHTVFKEESTNSGTGRYWRAVSEVIVADVGGGNCGDIDPLLWGEPGNALS
jgi:hypothetical protein